MRILMLIALAFPTLYLLVVASREYMERRRLSRFVARLGARKDAPRAVTELRTPFREIAHTALGWASESANRKNDNLVESADTPFNPRNAALRSALVQAAAEPLELRWSLHISMQAFFVLLATAPMSIALIRASLRLPEVFTVPNPGDVGVSYFSTAQIATTLFDSVRMSVQNSGWLVAYLAVIWAIIWWIHRPEVREARFVRSLLSAAAHLGRGPELMDCRRMVQALAPPRVLSGPLNAFALWLVFVTAGWFSLVLTADIRRSNAVEPQYTVLSRRAPVAVMPAKDVRVPVGRGGDLKESNLVSVSVGPRTVQTPQAELGVLSDDRRSIAVWHREPVDRLPPSGPWRLFGDGSLGMQTIKSAVTRLAQGRQSLQWRIAVRREVPMTGGANLYVDIPMYISPNREPDVELHVRSPDIVVNRSSRVAFDNPGWRTALRELVLPTLSPANVQPAAVRVTVDDDVSYQRFVAVLSAVDDGCLDARDCGLPGLGIDFELGP